MKTALLLVLLLTLPQCARDETLRAYGAGGKTWHLAEIDGTAFGANSSLTFAKNGELNAAGPCNLFSARQTAPYPWFDLSELTVTRRACPGLDAESQFLTALQEMTLAEILDGTLILSTGNGKQMVFKSSD